MSTNSASAPRRTQLWIAGEEEKVRWRERLGGRESKYAGAREKEWKKDTGWRRHFRYLMFTGSFLQKTPIVSGKNAERNFDVKAFYGSLPP